MKKIIVATLFIINVFGQYYEIDDSYFKQEICKSNGYSQIVCEGLYCYLDTRIVSLFGTPVYYILKAQNRENKLEVIDFMEVETGDDIHNYSVLKKYMDFLK